MSTARISRHVGRALALAFATALVAACSSAKSTGVVTETMPATPDDASASNTVDGAHGAESTPDAAPPAKDAAIAQPPPGACASEPAQAACITCCTNAHMEGSTTYFVALLDCMCLTDNCARECAMTMCDPMNPTNADATCNACIQAKNSACTPSIKMTCTADVDCTAFDACIGNSDCAGKSK